MDIQFFTLFAFAVLSLTVTAYFLAKVYDSGKRMKPFTERAMKNHFRWVNRFLGMTLISVVFVESMIRTVREGGGVQLFDTYLGWTHATFVGTYVLALMCMRFWITGLKAPRAHRFLFEFVVISFLGILLTGSWLTIQLAG